MTIAVSKNIVCTNDSSQKPLTGGHGIPVERARCFKMALFGQRQAETLVDLGLKRLPGNGLAVNADVALALVARDDSVRRNLAICHKGIVEKVAGFNCQLERDSLERRYIAISGDEVHQAVVGKGRREEIGVGCHIRHLNFASGG